MFSFLAQKIPSRLCYDDILLDAYLGCRYTLLVGKPPFETQSLKETYQRIKRNEYYIPSKVSHTAQLLIIKLLRPDPATRPNLRQVLEDEFFTGFTPNHLPISCLTMAPRFATGSSAHLLGVGASSRKPLNELNTQEQQTATTGRRDKVAFLEKVSKRRSLGVRVCGGESKLIQPGEAVAEELKDEDQEGRLENLRYIFHWQSSVFVEFVFKCCTCISMRDMTEQRSKSPYLKQHAGKFKVLVMRCMFPPNNSVCWIDNRIYVIIYHTYVTFFTHICCEDQFGVHCFS